MDDREMFANLRAGMATPEQQRRAADLLIEALALLDVGATAMRLTADCLREMRLREEGVDG